MLKCHERFGNREQDRRPRNITQLHALKLRQLGKQDGRERKEQTQQELHDEQFPKLAIVRWCLDGAGRLVLHFSCDGEDLIEVFRPQLTKRECQIGKGGHHRKERGLEVRRGRVGNPGQHGNHRDLDQR